MPFIFAQPIDLGGLPPLPAQPIKEGPKAPPPIRPFNPNTNALQEVKSYFKASDDPDDIPEPNITDEIALTLFGPRPKQGQFYKMMQSGIPVYRNRMDAVAKEVLSVCKLFGVDMGIPATRTLAQALADGD